MPLLVQSPVFVSVGSSQKTHKRSRSSQANTRHNSSLHSPKLHLAPSSPLLHDQFTTTASPTESTPGGPLDPLASPNQNLTSSAGKAQKKPSKLRLAASPLCTASLLALPTSPISPLSPGTTTGFCTGLSLSQLSVTPSSGSTFHNRKWTSNTVMAISLSCENLRNHLEQPQIDGGLSSRLINHEHASSLGSSSSNSSSSSGASQDSSSILILDCRTFLQHSEKHILGAVNVHCPTLLRRRLGNKLPLKTVIPDREISDRLLKGLCSPVVLYEESTSSFNRGDSTAAFVARCLQNETGINNIYILEGGFQQFRHQYPHLCVSGGLATHNSANSGLHQMPSWGSTAPSGGSSAQPQARSPNALWCHQNGQTTTNGGNTGSHLPPLPIAMPLSRSSSSPALASSTSPPHWHHHFHEQQEPVEILPHLFLGNEFHASSKATLQRLKITALLNVSHNCPNHFEDVFRYMSIPIEDSTSEDIGIWFRKAIEFINDVKASGGKVLVHCHAGISRSATICMAYLMATLRLRMEDAYEYVKSRRKIISPNFSFMGQLLSFESQVFSPRLGPQRSPRSPLSALQPSLCNNNPSPLQAPPPLNLQIPLTGGRQGTDAPSPRTPSLVHTHSQPSTPTAFDFSISPSTLASLVNSSSCDRSEPRGSSSSFSPSSAPSSPSTPTSALYPSSPYSP